MSDGQASWEGPCSLPSSPQRPQTGQEVFIAKFCGDDLATSQSYRCGFQNSTVQGHSQRLQMSNIPLEANIPPSHLNCIERCKDTGMLPNHSLLKCNIPMNDPRRPWPPESKLSEKNQGHLTKAVAAAYRWKHRIFLSP